MTDKLIFIVSALIILSGITEKLTQFARSYPTQVRILSGVLLVVLLLAIGNTFVTDGSRNIRWTMIFAIVSIIVGGLLLVVRIPFARQGPKLLLENITKDSPNRDAQESEINALSAIIGIVVAFMFNANMVMMFKINDFEQLGWNGDFPFSLSEFRFRPDKAVFSPVAFIGFLITGFFLTFGSKFFHDLLDLLLEVKNTRRIVNSGSANTEIELLRLRIDQKSLIREGEKSESQKAKLAQEIDDLNIELAKLIKAKNG
jgi:hypothetical protein